MLDVGVQPQVGGQAGVDGAQVALDLRRRGRPRTATAPTATEREQRSSRRGRSRHAERAPAPAPARGIALGGGAQVAEDRFEVRSRASPLSLQSRSQHPLSARDTRIRAAGSLHARLLGDGAEVEVGEHAQLDRAPLVRAAGASIAAVSSRASAAAARTRVDLVPAIVLVAARRDAEPLPRRRVEPRAAVVLADEVAGDPPQPRRTAAGLLAAEAAEPEQRLREGLRGEVVGDLGVADASRAATRAAGPPSAR